MDKIYNTYIKPNSKIYFFIILTFVLGLIAGSMCSTLLTSEQNTELNSMLNQYINKIQNGRYIVTKDNIDINNIYSGIIIAISGLFYLGIAVIFFIVGGKGFLIGFTVNYALLNIGGKGWLLVLSSIIPPNIIIIPVLIFQSVISICFILKKQGKNYLGRKMNSIKNYYKEYVILHLSALALLLFSGIVEVYISPLFFQLILNIFY